MQDNDLQQNIDKPVAEVTNNENLKVNDGSDAPDINKPENKKNAEEEKIQKLTADLAELQDKYLRMYSEFENFRRRTAKEKLEMIDFAAERVILDLLPVIDDFERAQQSMSASTDLKGVIEGINLIFIKLNKILTEKGLEEIKCIGKEFDPELHDAITKIPAPNKKMKGKIIDQISKGFLLKGKVIRHSKVVVGE